MRRLGACLLVAAVSLGSATASGSREIVPRFSLSATTATSGDDLEVRVERPARVLQREIRLYLVARDIAPTVRSRFDPRLSFIGSVTASRQARLVFTVPPLEPGSYSLAYWCRGCLPRGKGLRVEASPTLRVTDPAGEGCPATTPNGNVPPGAPTSWGIFQWHGNGALWAVKRPDGTIVTNPLGGWKQPWVAKQGWIEAWSARFTVRYRMLDAASPPVSAQTVSGTLGGYDGPSWASRMSFEPACWLITGRLLDVSLSFVAQVVRGDA